MSDAIVLVPRAAPERAVDADCVRPDRFAALGAREIAALPAWSGARAATLGDFFEVRGERAADVRVAGDVPWADGLGSGMAGGTLVIEGRVGRSSGAGMTGGLLEIHGDAGDDTGVAMAGGTLRVRGRAGDRLGGARAGAARGMTGGEIIVLGDAGAEAGAAARRGLVVIGGDAGRDAARGMIAGSVIVLGAAGTGAGRWSKRGTVVVMGHVVIGPGYRYACTWEPPHLRLTLRALRARHALPVPTAWERGRYDRWCGDMAALGKGEILHWRTA